MKGMLRFSLAMVLVATFGVGLAQTPYKGGQGDGYDSERMTVTLTITESLQKLDFVISPNPAKSGQSVRLKLAGRQGDQRYKIRMIDIIGNQILEKEFMANQTFMFNLQDEKLNPGLYIIEIRRGNLVTRKRFNVID